MATPRRSSRLRTAVQPAYQDRSDDGPPSETAPANVADDYQPFSADEVIKPSTKKRTVKAEKPTAPRKKQRRPQSTPILAETTANTLSQTPSLGKVRLNPSTVTTQLNKWVKVCHTLQVTEKVLPTKLEAVDRLTPLGTMPDMPGRDFTFDIACVDVYVNWDPVEGEEFAYSKLNTHAVRDAIAKYAKTIKTWRIHVWNNTLPVTVQQRFRLFPEIKGVATPMHRTWKTGLSKEPPNSEKHFCRGGPLDVDICSTEADARKVATEACRLLNKFPGDLDPIHFPDEIDTSQRTDSETRKTIELLSLRALDPKFDFRSIRYTFRHSVTSAPGQYVLNSAPGNMMDSKNRSGTVYDLLLPVFTTDSKIDKRRGLPSARRPLITIADYLYREEDLSKLPTAPSWWAFSYLVPMNDLADQRSIPWNITKKFFDYLSWQLFGYVGSTAALKYAVRELGNGIPITRTTGTSRPGPYGGKPLFLWNAPGLKVSTAVAKTISGAVPACKMSLPKTAYALAMQSSYEVFKHTNDILKGIEELFVSMEEIRLRKSILSVHLHCQCQSQDQKKEEAHYCMYCLQLVLCSSMSRTTDGRLVCVSHFRHGVPDPSSFLKAQAKKAAYSSVVSETDEPGTTPQEILNTLITGKWFTDDGYRDAYDGNRLETTGLHPLRMNLDAVFPLFRKGNSFFVHHAENVGLTTDYLNRSKSNDIPLILATAADAIVTAEQGGDSAKLARLELAFDHYFRINTVLPNSRTKRIELSRKQTSAWWRRIERMMRSGVFDGCEPIWNYIILAHQIPISGMEGWDDETTTRLEAIVEAIEDSQVYNPKQLKLPRSKSGAPWLWNPAHMFEDHDWAFIAPVFEHRFRRMDKRCDWINDHDQESAETLFLTCVILWFKLDGGKDEILGLRMTVFQGHALRFSIGRALHVAPGSIMRSGWTLRHPASILQYDESRRTITVETWFMNRGKYNYPVTAENIELFRQLFRDISFDAPYWNAYPPSHTLQHLDLPRSCAKWKRPIVQAQDLENETSFAEYVGADEDEDDIELGEVLELEEDNEDLIDLQEVAIGDKGDKTEHGHIEQNELNSKINYLASLVEHIPDREKEKYIATLTELGTWIQSGLRETATTLSTVGPDPTARLHLFVQAIGIAIKRDGEDSCMKIDELANAQLAYWQTLVADIQTPFSFEEIVAFCDELKDNDNFGYLADEAAFTFKP